MKYRVVGNPVRDTAGQVVLNAAGQVASYSGAIEINGVLRKAREVLDDAEFRPRPSDAPVGELSELESLLKTNHVEPVKE